MAADTATDHGPGDAAALIARAQAAARRDQRRLAAQIDDLFLPGADRLDDRSRARLEQVLRATVDAVDRDVRARAERLLVAAGEVEAAHRLTDAAPAFGRLAAAGLLRDPELIGELLASATEMAIAECLTPAVAEPDRPSLLTRLAASVAPRVAEAAGALLLAEGRRRDEAGTALPAELHHRLAWWVAAAQREAAAAGEVVALDRALARAVRANLAAQDEGARAEAAAMRLALAIDAREDELPALLGEAIGDRRLGLFTAILAHAARLPFPEARAIVLDPAGDRLWLSLRAAGLPREAMARIGLALSDADPRRDLEALADALDAAMATPREEADAAFEPARFDPDYRAACRMLAAAPRRG